MLALQMDSEIETYLFLAYIYASTKVLNNSGMN
jgi:hypothetical protein